MVQPITNLTYMVECFWPDVHEAQVEKAAERLRRSAERLSRAGQLVDYTESILIPGDDVVFYLFEAASQPAVEAACRTAGLRFERSVPKQRGMFPTDVQRMVWRSARSRRGSRTPVVAAQWAAPTAGSFAERGSVRAGRAVVAGVVAMAIAAIPTQVAQAAAGPSNGKVCRTLE